MTITTAFRRGLPAAALLAAGLALTACGPDHTTGSASPSNTTGAAAGATDTPGSGDTAAGTTGGSAAASSAPAGTGGGAATGSTAAPGGGGGRATTGGLPTCASNNLKVSTSDPETGAGSITFDIVFTNTGSTTCALSGYPGVSFADAHGGQVGNAATRTPQKAVVVTLIPNAHAIAEAKTADGPGGFPASRCHLTSASDLRVYPPNRTASLETPWGRKVCAGSSVHVLSVSPVHPVS